MVESLFAPPAPKAGAHIKEEHKRQESAANDQDRALSKYVSDTVHDRTLARQQEETRRREIERDQYERLPRGRRER